MATDRLSRLKNADHETLKKWIWRILNHQAKGCHRGTIVTKLCQAHEVTTLRGQPRRDFQEKVNKAIGALLREKEIKETGGNDQFLSLV